MDDDNDSAIGNQLVAGLQIQMAFEWAYQRACGKPAERPMLIPMLCGLVTLAAPGLISNRDRELMVQQIELLIVRQELDESIANGEDPFI